MSQANVPESTEQIQFFVLDVVTVILMVVLIIMGYFVYKLTQKVRQQKKLYDSLERTVDRILKIESGGGIDGRSQTLKERKKP